MKIRFGNVCLEAMGHVLPERAMSSEAIEARLAEVYRTLRIPPGRVAEMTGIRERRYWENGTPPSKGAIQAGNLAIERSGVSREDLGALVYTSVCRDHLEPATSTVVHDALGLPGSATCFDISNACLGFMNGLVTVANMIELGQIGAGVVVASENSGPVLHTTLERLASDPEPSRKKFKAAFPSLTLGSGSVAAVLVHKDRSVHGHRVLGGGWASATQYNAACRCTPDHSFADECHPFMETDVLTVMDRGCELARDAWANLKAALDWADHTPERVFCHQIGVSHKVQLFKTLELDVTRDFSTVERLGNMGSVGLPLTVSMGIEAGAVERGMRVAMLGIGSGLNSLMLGLEW